MDFPDFMPVSGLTEQKQKWLSTLNEQDRLGSKIFSVTIDKGTVELIYFSTRFKFNILIFNNVWKAVRNLTFC